MYGGPQGLGAAQQGPIKSKSGIISKVIGIKTSDEESLGKTGIMTKTVVSTIEAYQKQSGPGSPKSSYSKICRILRSS